MGNYLAPAIARHREAIASGQKVDGTGPISPEALAALDSQLANSITEHAAMQNAQASAHALGLISTEDAQIIYLALGEVPGPDGWAAGTDIATKVVVTQAMQQVIGLLIAKRRAGSR